MKFELRPFFKSILLTFITQGITLITLVFVYRLIAQRLGPEGVGEYSLIKRVVGFLEPILLLGLGVGISRYVAMSRDKEERNLYVKSGTLVVVPLVFFFLLFMNLFKEYFVKVFFGSADYIYLILPLSFLLIGSITHGLVYSYFRGRFLVKVFNSLQIANLTLVPLVSLLFLKNITVEKLITSIGIITSVTSFVFFLFFAKEFFVRVEKQEFKNSIKKLFCYSLPRIPADFALVGLFSLGPIIAAHLVSIQEVGYLSVGQSLVNIIGVAIAPLGLILLPKISNLTMAGKEKIIKENLNLFIPALIQCSVFFCFQSIIFADSIIKFWLGSDFLNAVPIMRIVFISLAFHPFYVGMRSVLDAIEIKPLNTINLLSSLFVFLFIAGVLLLFNFFPTIISLSIALSSGLFCLGILTYISIRKIYPANVKKDLEYLLIAILINVLLGGAGILLKPSIESKFYWLVSFFSIIGALYLSILWMIKIDWVREFPRRIGFKN
jgi:O-antigen/teichoic acid export membrane protein